MTKRIVMALLVVVLLTGGYWSYLHYRENQRFVDGEVTFGDVRDGDGVPAHATPSRSDDPGTVHTESMEAAPSPQAQTKPAEAAAPTAQPTQTPTSAPAATAPTPSAPADIASLTDSQSPNAPNGMAFAGTGRFQVYRQGNLTWRVNTETGSTCILFATNEEWRKPIVYHHGCNA